MHCWNIGCPGGPPLNMDYCVDLGWPEATAEGYRIMCEVMRPAMDAARTIGLPVVHVEADWMDEQYPHIPSRRDRTNVWKPTGRQKEMLDRAHGPDYMTNSRLQRCAGPKSCLPLAMSPWSFTPTPWTHT